MGLALRTANFVPTAAAPARKGSAATLERVKGIEPSSEAWKATALPLSYTRPPTAMSCGAVGANPVPTPLPNTAFSCAFWLSHLPVAATATSFPACFPWSRIKFTGPPTRCALRRTAFAATRLRLARQPQPRSGEGWWRRLDSNQRRR